jgi:hypothetical protein
MPDVIDRPPALHDHALSNLRFIRDTMERAGSFTSIPGWGGVLLGATAVVTAVIAHRFAAAGDLRMWLWTWLLDAVVAVIIGIASMWLKGRRAGLSLTSPAARRFFISYSAPLFTAALLTLVIVWRDMLVILPPLWLLMYGTSFVSSGAFSIRVVPVMGVCFILLGIPACFVSLTAGNVLLAAGFGGLHIVFGYIIARSHGG